MSLDVTKTLQEIFELEIARLHEKAKQEALDQGELNRLVALTRAWQMYSQHAIEAEPADLSDTPTDALLNIIK